MSRPVPQTDQAGAVAPRWHQATWVTVLRVAAAGLAIFVGLGTVLVVLAVGHCSAFGGTCPREGGFPDDTFGSAAFGGALAVAVPYYLKRPSWRRLAVSLVIGLVVGVAVGFFAVSATAG